MAVLGRSAIPIMKQPDQVTRLASATVAFPVFMAILVHGKSGSWQVWFMASLGWLAHLALSSGLRSARLTSELKKYPLAGILVVIASDIFSGLTFRSGSFAAKITTFPVSLRGRRRGGANLFSSRPLRFGWRTRQRYRTATFSLLAKNR